MFDASVNSIVRRIYDLFERNYFNTPDLRQEPLSVLRVAGGTAIFG